MTGPGNSTHSKGTQEAPKPKVCLVGHRSKKQKLSNERKNMDAQTVFNQQNGEVTKAYYAEMNSKGLPGQLAVALFRAQKRSTAAKKYRRGRFTRDAYDVKNWSISEVCRILDTMAAFESAPQWGWKRDSKTPGYEWVLYVDLPTGQCSFHSPQRLSGPDYLKDWDGIGMSEPRIIRYCDMVAGVA
jgi:hypothetical protein